VAFSPDGERVACGSEDQSVWIWNVRRAEAERIVLRGHDGAVWSVAFSRDGLRLASGSRDRTVRLWDLRQAEAAPVVLRGHEGDVTSVAFSPDGKSLASSGQDGTVRLWPLWDTIAEKVCDLVWRNLTHEEWRLFIGEGIRYERTCDNLPAGK
jgi:WD40 repeat protein